MASRFTFALNEYLSKRRRQRDAQRERDNEARDAAARTAGALGIPRPQTDSALPAREGFARKLAAGVMKAGNGAGSAS
jgi:hypothetical protein